MKHIVLPSILCCVCALVALAQQTNTAVPDPGLRIGGSVLDAITGLPLPGTRVIIAPVNKRDAFTVAVTGEDGRFTFPNLALGKYTLTAQHRGYLTQSFNQHGQFSSSIVVGPGLDSSNLAFHMTRESAISGTVMDEEGLGVREAQVLLFQSSTTDGRRETRERSATMTDDEGHFHWAHLTAGKYFLVVMATPWYASYPQTTSTTAQAAVIADNLPRSPLDVAYPLTFYPGVTDESAATPILLGKGEKVSADVTLHAVPAAHLRVTMENPDQLHSAFASLEVNLFNGTRVQAPTQSNQLAGVVEISGIAPGRYATQIHAWSNAQVRTLQERELTADGGGVIEKPLAARAQVGATIRFEPPSAAPAKLALQLRDKNSTQVFGVPASGKGEIEFGQGLPPGSYEVSVQGGQELYIQSMQATGARLNGRTLEIKGDAAVRLTMVVAQGMGEITGTVLRGDKPVAGVMIVLVPADPGNNRVLFRRDQSDSDGTFRLAGVVPGRYTLLAINDGWELEWANPAVLKKFMAQGETLAVETKGKYSVKLKVQEAAQLQLH
jgi:Carboxypeptidase regulatory-like domain